MAAAIRHHYLISHFGFLNINTYILLPDHFHRLSLFGIVLGGFLQKKKKEKTEKCPS